MRLQQEYGYRGGKSALYELIRRLRPARRRAPESPSPSCGAMGLHPEQRFTCQMSDAYSGGASSVAPASSRTVKYIGDAVMATFGTPSRGVDDAGRALQCAWELADETHRWSRERATRGGAPVNVGIGVHYGEAVLGSIGDAQRLDYVVVGDTVNVTSRLERLTRELDVALVVSDAA